MDLREQFETVFCSIPYGTSGQNLIDAEVVHGCIINEDFAKVTLIVPNHLLHAELSHVVKDKLTAIPEINRVAIEFLDQAPAEEPHSSKPSTKLKKPSSVLYLEEYKEVIAVASGKGGVGKSTVAVNLAIALAQMDYQVSLFDADIFGPSLPMMLNIRNERPTTVKNRILPIKQYGIQTMSIGNLIEEQSSVIWRGPMVHQAIQQLLRDTNWTGGDFMIIDLPPGTGDAQLTLSQSVQISGAVIVSTPQDVALLDARKAINMFEKVDVEVLGLVENMSSFICPHCQTASHIFGKHGAKQESERLDIPFLGSIPLELAVREGGDSGEPVVTQKQSTPAKDAFFELATALSDILS